MTTTAAEPGSPAADETDPARLFVDSNVLIFASRPHAAMHAAAVSALEAAEAAGDELWISRQVVREFLVNLTRPGDPETPLDVAADLAEALCVRFVVADETAGVATHLISLLRTVGFRGKNVHDANIVATMLAHGIPRLLTHNVKDFDRYADAGLIAVETF